MKIIILNISKQWFKTTSASSDMQNYKIVSLAYLALALLFILML